MFVSVHGDHSMRVVIKFVKLLICWSSLLLSKQQQLCYNYTKFVNASWGCYLWSVVYFWHIITRLVYYYPMLRHIENIIVATNQHTHVDTTLVCLTMTKLYFQYSHNRKLLWQVLAQADILWPNMNITLLIRKRN